MNVSEPTVAVRLAEARSLLELRAVDRAYNRIKDLVEVERPNVEALALATEIHLQRGWQGQAKRLATRGLEVGSSNALFEQLLQRASEPATEPDDSVGENELSSVGELIRLAEQHLCQGQTVRARTLLERVRRKVPDHRWAVDLLWAMEGDFATEATLADMCDRWGPDLLSLQDIGDEPEHTESARPVDLQQISEPDRGFSALFRGLAPKEEGEESTARDAEVTAVSSMAEVREMLDRADMSDKTDPHAEDTQIMRVQPKAGGRGSPTPARPSRAGDVANIADLRPQAMASRPDVVRDVPMGGDDEDDSVVVLLRRDDSTGEDANPNDISGLTEELEFEKAVSARRGLVEDAGWAATSADAPVRKVSSATPASVSRSSRPNPAPTLPTGWPWWVAVILALGAFGVVVLAILVLVLALGA
ncbi:MAG: hypothetical protein H6735_27245 [Alphaproteobacteria bacterium]|nr:hypothetical protein [Alphaproteobacteria bacterium]